MEVNFDKKQVRLDDLCRLNTFQKVRELMLCVPFLASTLICFQNATPLCYLMGLLSAFYFYLAGLRQAHGAFHYSLGIGRLATDMFLVLLSVPMLIPLHCVQINHLRHHKHLLSDLDIEGRIAHRSALGAIIYGPLFYVELIYHGYRAGNSRQKRYQRLEITLIVAALLSILFALNHTTLILFVLTMLIANCLSGFFAVWTVHRDSEDTHLQSRSQRGWLKSILVMNMFYHLEHHLYPQIHTAHWPTLAKRLDEILQNHGGTKDVY